MAQLTQLRYTTPSLSIDRPARKGRARLEQATTLIRFNLEPNQIHQSMDYSRPICSIIVRPCQWTYITGLELVDDGGFPAVVQSQTQHVHFFLLQTQPTRQFIKQAHLSCLQHLNLRFKCEFGISHLPPQYII